jgi:flavorubredoxin
METVIDEATPGIYRLSTYTTEAGFSFTQYPLDAEQLLLFHSGMRGLFPLIAAAVTKVMPVSRLRWLSVGHWAADESGSMNEWLTARPQAQVAVGAVGCIISGNDLAIRPPRPLEDGEVLDLGGKPVRYLATPQVPHCWDAGVMFEETTQTLFCGDLLTQIGKSPALATAELIAPAMAAEDQFSATALTPQTAPTMRRLATLHPQPLALMHGPVYHGECELALQQRADSYATRLQHVQS